MTEESGRGLRQPALLASLPEPASGLGPAGDDPAREQIDAWLTENCGRGIPYADATDLKTALHGLAYILRQIESTNQYKVFIGQAGPAMTALRWTLDHLARQAIECAPAVTRLKQFEEAVFSLPWVADRLMGGQQFNVYERASNDEDMEADEREYRLCIGPISDARHLCDIEGREQALLIEAGLKAATEALRERIDRDSASDPQGENSRSEVEGEASQSGHEVASPKISPSESNKKGVRNENYRRESSDRPSLRADGEV